MALFVFTPETKKPSSAVFHLTLLSGLNGIGLAESLGKGSFGNCDRIEVTAVKFRRGE